MIEQIKPTPAEAESPIKGYFKRIAKKIKSAFVPEFPGIREELREPTLEQSIFVDSALAQSLFKVFDPEASVDVAGQPYRIEYARVDTREEEKKSEDDPYFINLTGAWGRGPEVESEIMVLAVAMGKDGLSLDATSLPGHGASDNIPKGWNVEGDFDFAADFIAAHIAKIKEAEPKRKIIINCWSMGGVTALKLAAKYPHLIDGIILIDTPVFPQNFAKLALKFLSYEVAKIRSVKKEKPFQLETKLPGLGIFIKRLRERNKGGIPFDVLLKSGRSLAKQDVIADGTIDTIIQNVQKKDIPFYMLRGTNDYVVPHELTTKLEQALKAGGVDVQMKTIKSTGHALTAEQPVKTGELIREWMEEKGLVKKAS
ncbi:alpha/beta hydrolase [Candidatus Woesebacteria bacterium]|nr:alpha/beta hydrolase [Candidatus Woesebacteria bacterium]